MPPEMSDEEIAELRAAKAEKEQLAKDAKEARETAEALKKDNEYVRGRYNQDTAILQQQLQQRQAPQQPTEEDPEVLERRNEISATVQRAFQEGVAPIVSDYLKRERSTARSLAKQNPEIAKFLSHPTYGKEIEAMLDAQPAGSAGSVEAYEMATRAVKGLHFDDLVNERVTQATARRPDNDDDGEFVEPDTEEDVQRAAPLPTPTRTSAPATRTKQRKFEPLDRTEKQHAARMGITDEEFDRFSHSDLTVDIMGFNGRDRV